MNIKNLDNLQSIKSNGINTFLNYEDKEIKIDLISFNEIKSYLHKNYFLYSSQIEYETIWEIYIIGYAPLESILTQEIPQITLEQTLNLVDKLNKYFIIRENINTLN